MKGAICGDVIGSPFERRNTRRKDFTLFHMPNRYSRGSNYTDDSYLTVAVAEALMSLTTEELKDDGIVIARVRDTLIKYGLGNIPKCFGNGYKAWIESPNHAPYGALSNGAVMRCSSAGWIATSEHEAYRLGGLTAMPTHNHPDAVEAASVLCQCIYLLRNKASKNDIKKIITAKYQLPPIADIYNDPTINRGAPKNIWIAADHALMMAAVAFFEGKDFEDTIRTAVSLGGDSDTIADIAGALAEPYYGVPDDIWDVVKTKLTPQMMGVVDRFSAIYSE